MSVLEEIKDRFQAVILYLGQVPAIDATGLVALETAITKLQLSGHKVILAGLNRQPAEVLARAGLSPRPGKLAIAPDLDIALSLAVLHLARQPSAKPAA